ncbi:MULTISPECIES: 3-keto-5-aminohexanoate cleavage protein [Methylobacterium]|uniref:3-keto-5-aminohexanoate cleavage protein n=1 Tax=Methylobacterium TaxID=407 RepID=UPI0013ED337A|nr:3-keto-5-aminohexanoate cleavage protein [Methylobacterium sp. DB0501]NGM34430.1 3-keto-5-aminohexanoate cleavage protein [Methylobacterium sp. DB0501]
MIVQACLNGARPRSYHPGLPVTPDDMARQGAACVAAGAAELHVHPRAADGRESLAAVDETIAALRLACPGTLVGVSTGAWIEGSEDETRRCIATWRERPDYASVNLSERDAPAVMDALDRIGVRVEAGLATAADARRFLTLPGRHRVLRLLIEIDEQDLRAAHAMVEDIASILARGDARRPILLHGFDATVWPLAELAFARRWSTRVGLEDGRHCPDGSVAPDNVALVASAVRMLRRS